MPTNLLLPGQERWPLDRRTPILELVDVGLAFGDHVVFDGLDLRILPGEITAIVGRSGSGKTALLKLMLGLLHPDRGRVIAFGHDLATLSPVELLELRKRMGMVFQGYALFDALSVADNVGFALVEGSLLPPAEIARLSSELLATLGLAGSERLLPGELSGGMKKRVGLARALVANPEIVLFDEPTTGLDPLMVEKVDALIARAATERALTAVVVTHDLASIRRLAQRVAFLHDGKVVFWGTPEELFASTLPAIRAFLAEGTRASGSHRDREPASPPVVELVGVHKWFGDKHVLRGIDLAIAPRRTTVLIGASGSGKSVIVRHVMGLIRPDAGQVLVFGRDIGAMSERELDAIRARFGLVFQHAALLDWLSVEDNVGFPLVERRAMARPAIRERVADILERLHLGELRSRTPGELSLGQRKRVGIARALVTRPDVVIYDEPTTGQDPRRTREINDLIVEVHERFAVTSIVVSHDMEATFRIADTIAILRDGAIAAIGSPAEIRASRDPYVRQFLHAGALHEPVSVRALLHGST